MFPFPWQCQHLRGGSSIYWSSHSCSACGNFMQGGFTFAFGTTFHSNYLVCLACFLKLLITQLSCLLRIPCQGLPTLPLQFFPLVILWHLIMTCYHFPPIWSLQTSPRKHCFSIEFKCSKQGQDSLQFICKYVCILNSIRKSRSVQWLKFICI